MRLVKRFTFDPLNDIYDDGKAIQKRAVNKLIWVTMSDVKKAYLLWFE